MLEAATLKIVSALIAGFAAAVGIDYLRRRARLGVEDAEAAVRQAKGTADLSDDVIAQLALKRARNSAALFEALATGLEKVKP